MSTATYRNIVEIEDRLAERMNALREAERDVALRCNGMAFDGGSAEEIYRAGLDHCGISRNETAGLNIHSLRALLKHRPVPGSRNWRNAPSMAFDSTPGASSPLDSILKGIEPPRDISIRSDFRR